MFTMTFWASVNFSGALERLCQASSQDLCHIWCWLASTSFPHSGKVSETWKIGPCNASSLLEPACCSIWRHSLLSHEWKPPSAVQHLLSVLPGPLSSGRKALLTKQFPCGVWSSAWLAGSSRQGCPSKACTLDWCANSTFTEKIPHLKQHSDLDPKAQTQSGHP